MSLTAKTSLDQFDLWLKQDPKNGQGSIPSLLSRFYRTNKDALNFNAELLQHAVSLGLSNVEGKEEEPAEEEVDNTPDDEDEEDEDEADEEDEDGDDE